MKNLNSEETLWMILPIIIVLGLLIASIIILPQAQTETRSKASEQKPTPTTVTISPTQSRPEIICTSLYKPVCSQNGVTYPNACEANLAGVTAFSEGACSQIQVKPKPKPLPVSN